MSLQRPGWVLVAVVAAGVLASAPGSAQEREHFQLKLGTTYDEGDFGTSSTTRTVFAPLTLKYLGDRFDIGVTASFAHIETAGGVTLIEGTPTRTGTARRTATSESGVGDTLLKGRYFLIDDPGPGSPLPALTPFVKVKIPTADETRNLGTGEPDYGFGLEIDKQISSFFLFGDVSYTVIGSPPGQDLRDRPAASLGVGKKLSDVWAISGLVDWRRAVVRGREDPAELVGILTYKLARTISLNPNVSVGLTTGAPDFGVGFELAYKFGRY